MCTVVVLYCLVINLGYLEYGIVFFNYCVLFGLVKPPVNMLDCNAIQTFIRRSWTVLTKIHYVSTLH